MQVKEPPKEKRHINIGIDFGTSGTKVIYRDIIGKKAWVCRFDHGLGSYPDFVLPSSLRVIDEKLYFGGEAERRAPHGSGIRSFKICMACQDGLTDQESCNLVFDTFLHPDPRRFQFRLDSGNCISVSPCELGSYYLSHVLRFVKKQVLERFGSSFGLNITFNMCVPVNYLESKSARETFNRSLFFANHLSESVEDGVDINEVREAFRELDVEYPTIPGPESRPTFVQPETIVAVFSYVMSPVADDGLYAIADVGAGTTDIAFFRLSKLLSDNLAIYSAQTYMVGANEVDNSLYKWLVKSGVFPENTSIKMKNELIKNLGYLKEELSHRDQIRIGTRMGIFRLFGQDFGQLILPIGQTIFSNYTETWREAYKKEQQQSRWREYSLFRIGGGSKISTIRNQLSRKPWDRIGNITLRNLQVPTDLIYETGTNESIQDLYGRLAIAYGLSYHPAMYPNIQLPGEVAELKPKSPVVDLPPWYQYWEQD